MTLLLDSVILIDYLNGIDASRAYDEMHEPDTAISVVIMFEAVPYRV